MHDRTTKKSCNVLTLILLYLLNWHWQRAKACQENAEEMKTLQSTGGCAVKDTHWQKSPQSTSITGIVHRIGPSFSLVLDLPAHTTVQDTMEEEEDENNIDSKWPEQKDLFYFCSENCVRTSINSNTIVNLDANCVSPSCSLICITMSTQRVFSKNPIFVVIVSNDSGELRRTYYNVMFCKRSKQKRIYESQRVAHQPTARVNGRRRSAPQYSTSMPLMERCGLLFSNMDWLINVYLAKTKCIYWIKHY